MSAVSWKCFIKPGLGCIHSLINLSQTVSVHVCTSSTRCSLCSLMLMDSRCCWTSLMLSPKKAVSAYRCFHKVPALIFFSRIWREICSSGAWEQKMEAGVTPQTRNDCATVPCRALQSSIVMPKPSAVTGRQRHRRLVCGILLSTFVSVLFPHKELLQSCKPSTAATARASHDAFSLFNQQTFDLCSASSRPALLVFHSLHTHYTYANVKDCSTMNST